jgi:hypothetical protein
VENRARFDQNSIAMRSKVFLALAVTTATIAVTSSLIAGSPPPDLVKLERQVSLELAHVRDNGPVDDAKRKQLFNARQLEQKGEDAIKSGDYKSAEDSLLQARVILRQLSD